MGYIINPKVQKELHLLDNNASCPYCGQVFEAAADMLNKTPCPEPKDLCLCLKCGGFMRFDQNLNLRKIPLAEFMALENSDKQDLLHNYNMLIIYKRLRDELEDITFKLKEYFSDL